VLDRFVKRLPTPFLIQRPRSRRREVLQKPAGVIHVRVQKVGPEHFGIVGVDCAKALSISEMSPSVTTCTIVGHLSSLPEY
jgi:hypothetical protein